MAVRKDDQLILVCLGFSQWSENEVITDIGNDNFQNIFTDLEGSGRVKNKIIIGQIPKSQGYWKTHLHGY